MGTGYYNKTILIGRLADNPELHDNGKVKYSEMTILNTYVHDGETNVGHHHVVAEGKQADLVMKYLEKGNLVCIEGRLDLAEYEKDSKKKQRVGVIAEKITFLTPKECLNKGGRK